MICEIDENERGVEMDPNSPRSPMTSSVPDSPNTARGGGGSNNAMMDDGAGGSSLGAGPMSGGGGGGGPYSYPPPYGYYMGPPMGGGGGPPPGYGMSPYHGGGGGPPPGHPYGMHPHHGPPPPYRGGPPGGGMSSPYGRGGYGGYEYFPPQQGGSMPPVKQPPHFPPPHLAQPPPQGPPSQSSPTAATTPPSSSSPQQQQFKSTRGGFQGGGGGGGYGGGGGPNSSRSHTEAGKTATTAESRSDEATSPRSGSVPPHHAVEDLDAERAKASADAELTLSVVKPIQTDFHFFVHDVVDKIRKLAEDEVRASTADGTKGDPTYLINTNLNSRLMKAWEDLAVSERDSYAKREEEDRKRFMDEDEVASRHCATLTARVSKTPGEGNSGAAGKEESPPRRKKGKGKPGKRDPDDDDDYDDDLQIKNSESQDEEVESAMMKRAPGEVDEDDLSPSKKNRLEEISETADV